MEDTQPTESETPAGTAQKVGRNDACPCGSTKKFKKCCINEAAYNVPTPVAVATSAKTIAKAAAVGSSSKSAGKNASFKGNDAPAAKTMSRRKV